MSTSERFTLTSDHVKLLQSANLYWDDCETGAPSIDPKRPYGNSYVAGDVAEILGWTVDDEDGLTREQDEAASRLHSETLQALEILLDHAETAVGTYVRPSPGHRFSYCRARWRRDT